MTNLEMLTEYITDLGGFTGKMPVVVEELAKVVPDDIPKRMANAVVLGELTVFASTFRRNIQLDATTLIPINTISFIIGESGIGKDSTVKVVRKTFKKGYTHIEALREQHAKDAAIQKAIAEGKEDPESFHVYNEFYVKPPLLFIGIPTEQGMFKHCNKLENSKLGAGLILTGEVGAELATNSNMIPNIKLTSVLYDTGSADVTILKGEESQLAPIVNLPVSGIFLGSQENLLYDEGIKSKLKVELTTKLARRSSFTYVTEKVAVIKYKTVEEMLQIKEHQASQKEAARDMLTDALEGVALYHTSLEKLNKPIRLEPEANRLMVAYREWGKEVAKQMAAEYPISKITAEHKYWNALKIAGAFAIIENRDSIGVDNYVDAINYLASIDDCLPLFEDELRKDIFEQFVDYMHSITVDNRAEVPFHELLKKAYISKGGGITTKIKDMLKLANSKDETGLYTMDETTVFYERTVKTPTVGVSFIEVPETADKQTRGVAVANGVLTHTEGTFEDLKDLLEMDIAYSAFQFKNGKRKTENLIPETKWIVLDIDEGVVSDTVAHDMLRDINHHIARTSNPDNPMKYRILIELDAVVSLEPKQWKKFMQAVENYLQIPLDKLPMSQIYYAWSGRDVMSVTNKSPLETKHLILVATEVEEDTNAVDVSKLTKKQKEDMVASKQDTFWYLYECETNCSRAMIKAAYHMARLGADVETIIELLREVNDRYWTMPMAESRFRGTVLDQVPAIVAKVQ